MLTQIDYLLIHILYMKHAVENVIKSFESKIMSQM